MAERGRDWEGDDEHAVLRRREEELEGKEDYNGRKYIRIREVKGSEV